MELRKTITLAMLLALGVVLNIMESMIPIMGNIIPGSKLGLANIVVIFVIYFYGLRDGLLFSFTRVFIVGLLRTGLFNIVFLFSLSGGLLSVVCMFIAHKFTKLSIVGVSIIGAITHSIGQIIAAVFLFQTINIIYYLPYLLLLSLPTGFIIGVISEQVINQYQKIKINWF